MLAWPSSRQYAAQEKTSRSGTIPKRLVTGDAFDEKCDAGCEVVPHSSPKPYSMAPVRWAISTFSGASGQTPSYLTYVHAVRCKSKQIRRKGNTVAKRDVQILNILITEQKIDVSSLAQRLGVSEVTTRKDLDALQAKGLVLREHGYATLSNPNYVGGRLAYHYEEKLQIARTAADLVPDGATIMIESGSCCTLLARNLADTKTDVTIVTNSAFIADYVRGSVNVTAILLGGTYQRDSQVLVGPLVRTCAQEFYVDRLFIGADGWVEGIGPTNADQMRADAVRSMSESAAEVVVLTESEKFGHRGAVPMRLPGKRLSLVTDANIPQEWRDSLARDGVEVSIA